jgi:hypothetical protein
MLIAGTTASFVRLIVMPFTSPRRLMVGPSHGEEWLQA